jgi:perosamine synthetase
MIRLTVPSLDETEFEAIRKVLQSGWLVQGEKVMAFEQAMAQYVGTKHAIAVSSGTAALHLALLALGVRRGDIVVTTAYSWPATANVVELCGAQPVFVDIQSDTFNLDPTCLETTLQQLLATSKNGKRVKAILPVHTFGQLADMPAILEIAEKFSLPVVEDAACALGAKLHGRYAGTRGVMGCFSFHPRKAITTGEGGMITTNDVGLARRLKALRNHGQDPEASSTDFVLPGYNYRMTEFQAALGVAQMTKVEQIIATRRGLAAVYDQLLADTAITSPRVLAGNKPVYQSYVTLLPEHFAIQRDELIRCLRADGIETTIGTWHIPLTAYYRKRYRFARGAFPRTDDVFDRALTLPLHEQISRTDQETVVSTLSHRLAQYAD